MRSTSAGFTLLEILIAMTILAFLSIYTAQSIHTAVESRAKIQGDIDKATTVRDALRTISRDLHSAFNYRDVSLQVFNDAWKERIRKAEEEEKKGSGGKGKGGDKDKDKDSDKDPDKGDAEDTDKTEDGKKRSEKLKAQYKERKQKLFTHFIGEKESLHFTALSHTRTLADAKQSDQAEVGYFLRDCRNRINKNRQSKCLWRRSSFILDDDVTKGGDESVLLENVERFELRYINPDNYEEWLPEWKSDPKYTSDERTKDKFPLAVEITIGVQNKNIDKDKLLTMTMVAPLYFPNNAPPKTANEKDKEAENSNGNGNGNEDDEEADDPGKK